LTSIKQASQRPAQAPGVRNAGGLAMTSSAASGSAQEEKLAFLARAGSYPWPVAKVEVVETHMSWLFLTETRVCKLKKAVRRNGFDHRSARSRRLACERELRLNRRLAPTVYLQLLTLSRHADGRLGLGKHGREVDTLVCMRRLPARETLEARLRVGRVTERDIQCVVARLAGFWQHAPRVRLSAAAFRHRLARAAGWALAGLRHPDYGVDAARVEATAAALRTASRRCRKLLEQRARQHRIVEGHGDLRPEHIYLGRVPQIIDCIEFSRDLRIHDPLYELAFLAMECDRAGHREIDAWLFDAYARRTGDASPRALIDFYKAHNAFKRARIAAWHLDERGFGSRRRWVARTHAYLRLALGYLRKVQVR
jgi:aminoglycoside phosphotransferase family enzyme